jgi:replicative DNA helicase
VSIDRLPPQSIEAEQSVLGALLIDHDAVIEVADFLRPQDFYRQINGIIYQAILELYERREPADIVTVSEALQRMDALEQVGGSSYLTSLMNLTPTAVNAVHYGRIVERKAVLRNLIGAAGKIASIGFEDSEDVADSIDRAEHELFGVSERRVRSGFSPLKDLLHQTFDRLDYLHQHKGEISGIRTGFPALDAMTNGFQKSDLILIAARPSVGKTSLGLNIAEQVAVREHKTVGVFSLEMSKEQLVLRLLASVANIDSQRLHSGFMEELDFNRLMPAMNSLSQAAMFIDDTPNISTMELRTKARRLQAESGLDLIVIDYLQLMQPSSVSRDANRVQEVSEVSRGLKALARELNVPVIALSQLSRQTEMRTEREPRLSDLRECVAGDTLVCLADGRRVPIRQLVGTQPEVLSVSADGKLMEARSDLVWKVGRRPIFNVRLASGREIKTTGAHRLLSGSGWKRVEEFKPGDRIALARRLPDPAQPEEWSDARVALLGHLIGDGSFLVNAPLHYTTSSEENSQLVSQAAQAEFGTTVKRYAGRRTWHQITLTGNGNRWHPAGLNAWLRELGIFGQYSEDKRIPESAFRLSTRQIAILLRHLWATDGCISPKKQTRRPNNVHYSTNSLALAYDVAALLLRVGIVARIAQAPKAGYRTGYMVKVSGAPDQLRFLDVVGAFGPKEAPAARLREILVNTLANTNVDTLPIEIFAHVRERMRELGITQRKMASMRGTAYGGDAHWGFAPSRTTVLDYADHLDDDSLRSQATNDLFWDRVTGVAPYGEEDVYDLTVPGPASWVADGIVSHNSGALEQDSDLVIFLWREKERASEDDQSEGEVINMRLAKHRNGPTGETKLYFKKRQTRFVQAVEDDLVAGANR